jgi:hypothetical protein
LFGKKNGCSWVNLGPLISVYSALDKLTYQPVIIFILTFRPDISSTFTNMAGCSDIIKVCKFN